MSFLKLEPSEIPSLSLFMRENVSPDGSGAAMIFILREHFRGSTSWGSVGGAPPPDAGGFTKIFLIKLLKWIILAYFSRNLTKHALNFRAFGRKAQIVGKFWEIFKKFLKEIAKNLLV